jgi:hypothetical protein
VLLTSPDGVRWQEIGRARDEYEDTTNVFWNPFRKVWVYNGKAFLSNLRRCRVYAEVDRFDDLCDMATVRERIVEWYRADKVDDRSLDLEHDNPAQVYDLFCVPYESVILAAINVHYGPENDVCDRRKIPKLLQIHMGFSRDGFHLHRPTHDPFIPATRAKGPGSTDYGYLRPCGSILNVVGDKLHFYYMAASGIDRNGNPDMYTGITINLAVMRRDGFAAMEAKGQRGTLTTRAVRFSGSRLFVNVECPEGELRVEVLDEAERPIGNLTAKLCHALSCDSTCAPVTWVDTKDLSAIRSRPVRFRFDLTNGRLYSFWVARDQSGASRGYLGGGGPGHKGAVDLEGV